MPITTSAKKALRQSRRRETQNKIVKRALAATVKSLRKAIEGNDAEKIRALLPAAYQKIDKAAKKGLIHQNAASRQKSLLQKRVNKVLQS